MHAHSNAWHVYLELSILAVGLPVLGLISAVLRWHRSRSVDEDGSPQVRLGLRSIAISFAAYLIWFGLTLLPSRNNTSFAALISVLLSMTGAIAAGSGLVLVLVHARGSVRAGGAILALLGLAYAVASGLALLAGGGAPG